APARRRARPSAINRSYFSVTPLVMSVRTTPGRTSYTGMSTSARRTANSAAAIARPALDTQYSPRLVDTTLAEIEVTNTMTGRVRGSAARVDTIWLATA